MTDIAARNNLAPSSHQAVDHPYLIVHGPLSMKEGNQIPSRSYGESPPCGICQDEIDSKDLVYSKCKHAFHRECIREYIASAPTATPASGNGGALDDGPSGVVEIGCPSCYSPLTVDLAANFENTFASATSSGTGRNNQGVSSSSAAAEQPKQQKAKRRARSAGKDDEVVSPTITSASTSASPQGATASIATAAAADRQPPQEQIQGDDSDNENIEQQQKTHQTARGATTGRSSSSKDPVGRQKIYDRLQGSCWRRACSVRTAKN